VPSPGAPTEKLQNGSALATFRNMVACHAGDPDAIGRGILPRCA